MAGFRERYLSTVTWRRLLWALPIILLGGIAPMLVGVAAEWSGQALGCVVNDGTPAPCGLQGIDLKPLLFILFQCGWAVIVTLPVAVMAFCLWQFALAGRIILLIRRKMGR